MEYSEEMEEANEIEKTQNPAPGADVHAHMTHDVEAEVEALGITPIMVSGPNGNQGGN